jgi:hypothetical protein
MTDVDPETDLARAHKERIIHHADLNSVFIGYM